MAIPKSRGQILVEMAKVLCKEKRPVAENDDESEEEPFQSSGSEYVPSEASEEALVENNTVTIESGFTNNDNNRLTIGRPKRGRKRKYPNQNRLLRKKFCNENKAYISAKGQKVDPKHYVDFSCGCKRKCTEKISTAMRQNLFSQFWTIGSFPGRCAFLNGIIREMPKKRTYTKNKESKRNNSRKYFIEGSEVCKTTILKTFQISQNRIDVALKKKLKSIIQDDRGVKSGGRNKCSAQQIQSVLNHINSFPTYISHYCRKETEAKYLNPDLNLAKMYDLYKELSAEDTLLSLSTYKSIFYTKCNLKFKSPKKDTCLACDTYKAKIVSLHGEEREKLEKQHKEHIDKAQTLRNTMNADLKDAKSNEEVETLTFDLQKTHPLPKLPTGKAYYLRQLNFYNLGIHIGSTNRAVFNVWTENIAGRGTQEVGSCLLKYMKNNIRAPVKELRLWSDSCGGQNRSIKLVLLLLHGLSNHSSLETITMRFLLSGHSFLPNDSEFGDVESALKYQERVYTDLDYIATMEKCRRKRKFTVLRYDTQDFISVDNLVKSVTNRKQDINKNKVSWLNCHEILIKKSDPKILAMKSHVTQNEPQIVNIGKPRRGRSTQFKDLELPCLWPNGKCLSNEKVANLNELIQIVPEDAKYFYNFLTDVRTKDFQDDVNGFGDAIDFETEETFEYNGNEENYADTVVGERSTENDV